MARKRRTEGAGSGEAPERDVLPAGYRWLASGKIEGSRHITLPSGQGKRIYATGTTKKKVKELLEARVALARAGQLAPKSTLTFGAYATKVISEREGLGDRTRDLYTTNLRLYLAPLHAMRLGAITPSTLRTLYAGLRRSEKGFVVRGHAHTLVRLVLETARQDGLIITNPADVKGIRPKRERGDAETPPAYNKAEARRFRQACSHVTYGDVLAFILLTGMRRGEALGLRWSNVRIDGEGRKVARVETTRSTSSGRVYETSPKTSQSIRDVPLSRDAVALVRKVREAAALQHAAVYPDRPGSPYVFSGLRGRPLRPDNMRRVYLEVVGQADRLEREALAAAGRDPDDAQPLRVLDIHALRHTFVTLAAEGGMTIGEIAGIIGDSVATVLKVYLHIFKDELVAPELGFEDDEDGAL
ncbi:MULTISPECIES: tyrosine-type recombinase/integrase [Deinococcus]|uniref:Tyrosine-type recombinase/integrase n=1 Tax=Deinococcus rufus TaxID=2136097 RepID=A0ABV7Z8G0_9DEIO|nr:site-specific integrase [Deinococcus sp. AB2017081]WQE94649.1 site-specific integrase [Deinococcus sp. AB2017081]